MVDRGDAPPGFYSSERRSVPASLHATRRGGALTGRHRDAARPPLATWWGDCVMVSAGPSAVLGAGPEGIEAGASASAWRRQIRHDLSPGPQPAALSQRSRKNVQWAPTCCRGLATGPGVIRRANGCGRLGWRPTCQWPPHTSPVPERAVAIARALAAPEAAAGR